MNGSEKKLDDLIAALPKDILNLEVVEIYGDDPSSIHVTSMSQSLSYGIMAMLRDQKTRDSYEHNYFQVGVFKDYDSAMAFANILEHFLHDRKHVNLDIDNKAEPDGAA